MVNKMENKIDKSQTLNGTDTVQFNVSFDADAKKRNDTHKVTVIYDYNGITVGELIEIANKSLNIKVQARLKKSFATADHMAENIKSTYEYSVMELMNPTRRSTDPVQSGLKAIAGMSAEQFEAFKAQIEAMQK